MLCNWIEGCNSARGRTGIKTIKIHTDIGWEKATHTALKIRCMYYGKTYSFGKTEMFAKNVCLLLRNKLAFSLGFCNGSLLVSAQEGIHEVTQSVLCTTCKQ